jgi:hypothetical protein
VIFSFRDPTGLPRPVDLVTLRSLRETLAANAACMSSLQMRESQLSDACLGTASLLARGKLFSQNRHPNVASLHALDDA